MSHSFIVEINRGTNGKVESIRRNLIRGVADRTFYTVEIRKPVTLIYTDDFYTRITAIVWQRSILSRARYALYSRRIITGGIRVVYRRIGTAAAR